MRRIPKNYYDRIAESRAFWVSRDKCSQIRIHITADLLKTKCKENDTIIDVGCGTGETFAHLRKLRGSGYIIGLDISRNAAKIAKNYSDDIIISNAELLPLRKDVADAIVCIAVLEHLINPEQCLKEISRVSKTGTYAIIQVPNNNSFLSKLKLAHTDPEHLHSFTINSLKKMLEGTHIRPIRVFSDAITALPFLKSLEMKLLKLRPDFGDNIFIEALVNK